MTYDGKGSLSGGNFYVYWTYSDVNVPEISNVNVEATDTTTYTISAEVTDDLSGVKDVIAYYYSVDDEDTEYSVTLTNDGNLYSGVITNDGTMYGEWIISYISVEDYAYNYDVFAVDQSIVFEEDTAVDVTDVFSDVDSGNWFTPYVQYVYDKGLMSGYTGTSQFGPNDTMTRAQMVQVLYNMAGRPEVTDYTATLLFSDVYSGAWYENAVNWAYNNGVTVGMGDVFGVSTSLNREQMVTFLMNYAKMTGLDTTERTDITEYYGYSDISSWAKENISWAVGIGLISGVQYEVNGQTVYDLSPQSTATRAQLATVLTKFCQYYNL